MPKWLMTFIFFTVHAALFCTLAAAERSSDDDPELTQPQRPFWQAIEPTRDAKVIAKKYTSLTATSKQFLAVMLTLAQNDQNETYITATLSDINTGFKDNDYADLCVALITELVGKNTLINTGLKCLITDLLEDEQQELETAIQIANQCLTAGTKNDLLWSHFIPSTFCERSEKQAERCALHFAYRYIENIMNHPACATHEQVYRLTETAAAWNLAIKLILEAKTTWSSKALNELIAQAERLVAHTSTKLYAQCNSTPVTELSSAGNPSLAVNSQQIAPQEKAEDQYPVESPQALYPRCHHTMLSLAQEAILAIHAYLRKATTYQPRLPKDNRHALHMRLAALQEKLDALFDAAPSSSPLINSTHASSHLISLALDCEVTTDFIRNFDNMLIIEKAYQGYSGFSHVYL